MDPLHERLRIAAQAVRDDIRGLFKRTPEYKQYLADLLDEAARAVGQSAEKEP